MQGSEHSDEQRCGRDTDHCGERSWNGQPGSGAGPPHPVHGFLPVWALAQAARHAGHIRHPFRPNTGSR